MGQYGASELIEIHSTTDASTLFKALRSNDPQNRGQKINIWVPSNTRTSRMTAAVPLCTSQWTLSQLSCFADLALWEGAHPEISRISNESPGLILGSILKIAGSPYKSTSGCCGVRYSLATEGLGPVGRPKPANGWDLFLDSSGRRLPTSFVFRCADDFWWGNLAPATRTR